jgi:hypothetical protein
VIVSQTPRLRTNRASPRHRRQRSQGVVQTRKVSQLCRLERVAGCGIIGERRTGSAHLHRPWRATLRSSLRRAKILAPSLALRCRRHEPRR